MRETIQYAARLGMACILPAILNATVLQNDLASVQLALGVPLSIAKVTDAELPPTHSFPDYILIQDIHQHPEVQGHIAAILLYGSHAWDLKDVYLEGADASNRVLGPQGSNMKSLREALADGRLSGAEMAAALEPDSQLELHGMEDPDLYRKNVRAYERVDQLKGAALRELDTLCFFQNSLDMTSPAVSTDEKVLLQKMLQLRLKSTERTAYWNTSHPHYESAAVREAIGAAEDFYSIADERSEAFLKNSESESLNGPRVLVVGGYHTAKMAEELRKQGLSFVVLSPQVTQSGYDDLYTRGMQQTISALKLH